MAKIEIGINENGEFAVLKLFNDQGYFTRDDLEAYKSLGTVNIQDGFGIKIGPINNEYLKRMLENQENKIKEIKEKIKA